jgi:hypothetical protein
MNVHADLWSNKLEFTSELYRSLADSPLCYLFNGSVTTGLNDRTLSLAEDNFEVSDAPVKLKRRVFYIMVECLQNITRHQDHSNFGLNNEEGLFVLREIDGAYIVTSGNVVDNGKVDELKEHLNTVNELDAEKLTTLYRKVLFTGSVSAKGGAGLGLIDIARKGGSKLAYDFKAISTKQSFFYFQTKISLARTEGVEPEAFAAQEQELSETKELHKIIGANNVSIVYKGNFTQDSVHHLVMMAEGNVQDTERGLSIRKKVLNIMVELLQNISKHADVGPEEETHDESHKNPGIFLLGTEGERFILTAGNWVQKSKVEVFRDRLSKVNELNQSELESRYEQIIVEGSAEERKGAGLGLVDMRLKSGKKLPFDFRDVDGKYAFFTLQVEV